jgi:hypothetical protein
MCCAMILIAIWFVPYADGANRSSIKHFIPFITTVNAPREPGLLKSGRRRLTILYPALVLFGYMANRKSAECAHIGIFRYDK